MLGLSNLIIISLIAPFAAPHNFAYEGIQQTAADAAVNPDITFATSPVNASAPKCKTFPGDATWPSSSRWAAFNASLGGALLKAVPPAAACYSGVYADARKCEDFRRRGRNSSYVIEDPLLPFLQWTLGNPCPLPLTGTVAVPLEECRLESYPAYVVNASTVKHVQMAVNFARNNNIRLTIKNTGHDFLGRNTGGGALQVYVHHLKGFEYLPSFKIGHYEGKAARVGAAVVQYELFEYMEAHNITMVAPGGSTVGVLGGYMQGGGFSYISSKFGFMADQVLSLELVTADGRSVHASPDENEDLFWAIRGGGPSNFGIVTSAVIKAHDQISVSKWQLTFSTSGPSALPNTTFWAGVTTYFAQLVRINDAKGIGWNTISTQAPSLSSPSRTFSFTGQVIIPGMTASEFSTFLAPLISALAAAGIESRNATSQTFPSYPSSYRASSPGDAVGNSRFVSRLFPRTLFLNTTALEFGQAMASIRAFVEKGGYSFHSVDFHAPLETAGHPGADSAVSPYLRASIMHATGFDTGSYGPERSRAEMSASHARLDAFARAWRDASPGSGAYMNEADTEEPDFRESFFGGNYKRLERVKEERDPWGVFWAVTGVGSEGWVVEGQAGLPSQEGRLCKV